MNIEDVLFLLRKDKVGEAQAKTCACMYIYMIVVGVVD